ncbi:MAG: ribulose-phosphate 3-epimerase [Clostridia bacterium]|nr:ribulose-phosphate 3-epimerase [Clostridia bacterium]
MKLAPSILSADFSALGDSVRKIKDADLIHVDVMDGHFVPNISFGAAVMKSLNKVAEEVDLNYDVHLMIEDPDKYMEDFLTDRTEYITVHEEACKHLDRTINHVKSLGVKAGVSINPATAVSNLENILPMVDLVLIMSVNPGFGGQSFIEYTLDKVSELDELRKANGYKFEIEIDGGINLENAKKVVEAGADILVAGSAVCGQADPAKAVADFKKVCE